jgi:very-short-patch-repair endonuclease
MGPSYDADRRQISIDRRITRLVAEQHGVFSHEQAKQQGASKNQIRWRIESGRWERVHQSVYRISGSPTSWRQMLLAACLAWGPKALISHRCAAAMWKFPGFEPTKMVEITVPRRRHRDHTDNVVHWMNVLPADATILDAIPVTTPSRTLFDIASVMPQEIVEEALDDAMRRKLTSIRRLHWYIDARRGKSGIRVIRTLLEMRGNTSTAPESVLETRVLRALRAAGLPKPALQYPIHDDHRLVAVVDFAFPAIRLAIEADGYRWHSGRLRWEHDLGRRNALTSLGWRVMHVTWKDLETRPDHVIRTIDLAARAAQQSEQT